MLGNKVHQLQDAVRPGGSNDPNQFLNPVERSVWAEVSALGMPPASWEDFDGSGRNRSQLYECLLAAAVALKSIDPTYVDEFWSRPGYLGTEHSGLGDLF